MMNRIVKVTGLDLKGQVISINGSDLPREVVFDPEKSRSYYAVSSETETEKQMYENLMDMLKNCGVNYFYLEKSKHTNENDVEVVYWKATEVFPKDAYK